MTKPVPHEITFMSFVRNDDGTLSVNDIAETSYHYAAGFFRRYRREPTIVAVATLSPGMPWAAAKPRFIEGRTP